MRGAPWLAPTDQERRDAGHGILDCDAGRLDGRLQHPPAAFGDRLLDPRGLCRAPDRDRRRNQSRDSGRRWVKVQRQVRSSILGVESDRFCVSMYLKFDQIYPCGNIMPIWGIRSSIL